MMILRSRIRLRAALALPLLACAVPAAAQESDFSGFGTVGAPMVEIQGPVADSVRAVLRGYLGTAQRADGPAAARMVTRGTRDFYARMRDLAVSAPEAVVREQPLMDRMTILMMRHRIPAAELRALEGDAVFAYTVSNGWVGGAGDIPEPSEIFGEGDRAMALVGALTLDFVREDGEWRWDMLPMLRMASEQMAPEGVSEDEFLMLVLRYSNGREPTPAVWQPLP